jgi:hypothetical protein
MREKLCHPEPSLCHPEPSCCHPERSEGDPRCRTPRRVPASNAEDPAVVACPHPALPNTRRHAALPSWARHSPRPSQEAHPGMAVRVGHAASGNSATRDRCCDGAELCKCSEWRSYALSSRAQPLSSRAERGRSEVPNAPTCTSKQCGGPCGRRVPPSRAAEYQAACRASLVGATQPAPISGSASRHGCAGGACRQWEFGDAGPVLRRC